MRVRVGRNLGAFPLPGGMSSACHFAPLHVRSNDQGRPIEDGGCHARGIQQADL